MAKMIWSLLEAEGSAMSSFLQMYLLKNCADIREETRVKKGRNGCVRFVNIDTLPFDTMVRALRTKSFDVSSQQTVLEATSPEKECSALDCTQDA